MRLVQASKKKNIGYSWAGVVVLLKEATIRETKAGDVFNAWVQIEKTFKDEPRVDDNAITVVAMGKLAKMMVPFKKGTALFVAGQMEKSDFWTQKNGKDTYEIRAEFIHDQHDYRGFEQAEYEKETEGLPAQSSKDAGVTF